MRDQKRRQTENRSDREARSEERRLPKRVDTPGVPLLSEMPKFKHHETYCASAATAYYQGKVFTE